MLHVLQYEMQLIYTPVSDFQDNRHCIFIMGFQATASVATQ